MEQDIPRVKKSPRVSVVMVKTLSMTVVTDSPKKEKIPDKPVDEDEKKSKGW